MPTSLEGLPRCTSYTGFNPARRGARAVERFTMPSITKMKKDIVIVGGGVTGLAAAYYIQKNRTQQRAPIDVLLVEKENRLGGKIRTETADGFLIEGGPDCFISEKPAALRLSGELDLGSSLLGTNEQYQRTYILWKKKLHPLPEGFMLLAPTSLMPFVTDSLISPLGKLRVGLDLILPAKKTEEEETLAQFVRRRMGEEVLHKIAEPLVAGVHASNPETMSLKSTFPRFIEIERQHRSLILGMVKRRKLLNTLRKNSPGKTSYTMFMTFKAGLGELTNALRTVLDPQTVILDKEVVNIQKEYGSLAPGRFGYLVTFADGSLLSSKVILITTPAFAACSLIEKADAGLAAELSSIPYVSTATVSLAYRERDIAHPLNGFGFVVPRLEGRRIMAATWTSRKFPFRTPPHCALIRCFIGGAQHEELALLPESDLISLARKELREILGITADPLLTRAYRWRKSMPQYVLGHTEKVDRIEAQLATNPGLFLAGGAYRGIGISDCIVSGEQAAARALRYLESEG